MPRILLIEGNEMNRNMLSRRLERKGYQVLLTVDGQNGMVLAQAESPDLILMDMSLPLLDGWEASRRLKADPPTRRVPIIHAETREGEYCRRCRQPHAVKLLCYTI